MAKKIEIEEMKKIILSNKQLSVAQHKLVMTKKNNLDSIVFVKRNV